MSSPASPREDLVRGRARARVKDGVGVLVRARARARARPRARVSLTRSAVAWQSPPCWRSRCTPPPVSGSTSISIRLYYASSRIQRLNSYMRLPSNTKTSALLDELAELGEELEVLRRILLCVLAEEAHLVRVRGRGRVRGRLGLGSGLGSFFAFSPKERTTRRERTLESFRMSAESCSKLVGKFVQC